MKREELSAMLTQIGTVTDDAERRNLITQVCSEVNDLYDAHEHLSEQSAQQTEEIEKLQGYNMKLYLQVQGNKKEPDKIDNSGDEKPVLKYENLFDEKGEIK